MINNIKLAPYTKGSLFQRDSWSQAVIIIDYNSWDNNNSNSNFKIYSNKLFLTYLIYIPNINLKTNF